jgi:hypothetical protein
MILTFVLVLTVATLIYCLTRLLASLDKGEARIVHSYGRLK